MGGCGGDMGEYSRADGQEQRYGRQPVILIGQIEIAIEGEVCEFLKPAMLQVHQQEGEIIEDVDAGEFLGEFEAVEQYRLTVEQADVPQVKIAVAASHFSHRTTDVQ